MWKSILYLVMLSGATQIESSRTEMASFQTAVDAAVTGTGARVMNASRATSLDGYGIVVVLEVMLEQPPNPFSSVKAPDEVRTVVSKRRKEITDKLSDLLKARIKTASISPAESMAVIVHLLNATRADVPDLPNQLVLSVRKAAPDQIRVRETQ